MRTSDMTCSWFVSLHLYKQTADWTTKWYDIWYMRCRCRFQQYQRFYFSLISLSTNLWIELLFDSHPWNEMFYHKWSAAENIKNDTNKIGNSRCWISTVPMKWFGNHGRTLDSMVFIAISVFAYTEICALLFLSMKFIRQVNIAFVRVFRKPKLMKVVHLYGRAITSILYVHSIVCDTTLLCLRHTICGHTITGASLSKRYERNQHQALEINK